MPASTSTSRKRSAKQIVDAEYLLARSKILELAATLDRIDRGQATEDGSAERKMLEEAIKILQSLGPDRAERLQLLLSHPYDPQWRSQMGL
jgi:hypothetical protein